MSQCIRVWDWPVRLTHWGLVVCIAGLYATGEYGWLTMDWHFRFGYAALTIVLFRIVWGFVGSEHARFADFVRGPRAVIEYIRSLTAPAKSPSTGHSALGGIAVLALLGLTLVQAGTGLFSNDQVSAFGPLSERVSMSLSDDMTDWHELGQQLLLILIGIHVIAVLAYLFFKRENLIAPMFHGRKSVPGRDAQWRSNVLALVLFGLCAGGVWGITAFGPP